MTMEGDKVRSSSRIRKPTAKMKDNQNAIKVVSKKKVDKTECDDTDESKQSKNAAKKCDTIDKHDEKNGLIVDIHNENSEESTNSIPEASSSLGADDEIESKPENVSNTEKKKTVQVCVRLKDMIVPPCCSEGFESRKQDNDDAENDNSKVSPKDFNKSESLYPDMKKECLEDFSFSKVNHKKTRMFKEDGSFVETYEGGESESKGFRSKERNSLKQFNSEEGDRLMEGIDGNDLDNFEESSKDVDVQAGIELEHLDMSDVELSDFDEEEMMENSLQCNICSKSFTKKYYLAKHMALHTDVKPFQCEICGMSFATKAYLSLHSVVHSGIRKFKCEICDKAFRRRANLNTHRRTHSDVKAFSCNTCNKMFKTKSGRDLHMKEHGTMKGYQCHQCGKSFSQQAYLLTHISIHAGVKPFKCTECGKSFPYKQSLQEHMRRHTGEKPETCDQCGKKFNNKRQLKVHMKYHNTVSQYSCKKCNLFYDSQQSLNKHLTKTHNRRYECTMCKKSFINKKHLRSHKVQEHKQLIAESRLLPAGSLAKAKKAVCSLCNSVFYNRYVLSKHLMSIHRLPEEDMKELLKIRKKTSSKNYTGKKMTNNANAEGVDDKSFRVYYKDEEMAVYVKGTDDFETRLKAMTEIDKAHNDGENDDEGVRYIVLEDNGMNEANVYNEITYSNNDTGGFELKKNQIKEVGQESDTNIVTSNDVEQNDQEVNAELGDQNYYVVFTEANENSDKMVEEIHSEVIVKEELQNLNDDGTERIVLILNEGDDGKNFMLENGEQLQILSDSLEFLPASIDKEKNNYEVMTTDELTVAGDLNCQNSIATKDERFIADSRNSEPVVVSTSEIVEADNQHLLEEFQSVEKMNEAEKLRNLTVTLENTESKNPFQNLMQTCVISESVTSNEVENVVSVQYQKSNDNKSTDFIEDSYIFAQAGESVKAQSSMGAEANKESIFTEMETETNAIDDFLPKDNSAEEFTHFENALKSKSGDFESVDEYNNFIDKMIQTLQKAKHSDQE